MATLEATKNRSVNTFQKNRNINTFLPSLEWDGTFSVRPLMPRSLPPPLLPLAKISMTMKEKILDLISEVV